MKHEGWSHIECPYLTNILCLSSSQDAASVHVLRTSLLFSDVLEREVFGDAEMHDMYGVGVSSWIVCVACVCIHTWSEWSGCVFIHGPCRVSVWSPWSMWSICVNPFRILLLLNLGFPFSLLCRWSFNEASNSSSSHICVNISLGQIPRTEQSGDWQTLSWLYLAHCLVCCWMACS